MPKGSLGNYAFRLSSFTARRGNDYQTVFVPRGEHQGAHEVRSSTFRGALVMAVIAGEGACFGTIT